MITEEEWQEWSNLATTKALREWARTTREELKEYWAGGSFTAAATTEMLVKNAGATGACSILLTVQELDYNQIVESQNDSEQPVGPGTPGQSSID